MNQPLINTMKSFFYLLTGILFSSSLFSFGQDLPGNITAPFGQKDTSLISELIDHANRNRRSNVDSAIYYANEALDMSIEIGNNKGIAVSNICLGTYYFEKEDFATSKKYFQIAILYSYKASKEQPMLIPKLYNNLANVALKQGSLDTAVAYYYKAIQAFLKIDHEHQDSSLFMLINSNLGISLVTQNQKGQSFYYLDKGINLSMALKDTVLIAQNLMNKGVAFESIKNGDSARIYYHKALYYYTKIKDIRGIQQCYHYLGITNGREGNITKAKHYLDSAVAVAPEMAENMENLQKGLGDVYYALGEYRKSIQYFEKSLQISAQKGSLKNNLSSYYTLAQAYEKTGRNDLAYRYQKEYSDLKDNFLNEEKIRTIHQLEIQHRVSAQQQMIAENKLLVTQQQKSIFIKNAWIIGTSAGALLLGALSIFIYRSSKHKQKLQNANLERLQLQQNTNRLLDIVKGEETERNRIARELHDGIASILSAAKMNLGILKNYVNDPKDNTTYNNGMMLLDDAYRSIRHTAHNLLTPAQIMKEGLFTTTEQYCNKINQTENFNILFQYYGLEPNLKETIALFLFRVIQELIHNTIKHANATEVIVEIGTDDTFLNIAVEDNGMGMSTIPPEENRNGMGLSNLSTRIENLGGKLEIDSRLGIGTTIYLIFELQKLLNNESA